MSRAASSPRSGPTCIRSGIPNVRASRSSRGCRCSGSSRSSRWPGPPATRCARARSPSARRRWRRATSTGSITCTTGASAASSGGATASRSGTHPTGPSGCASARARRRRPGGPRTRTCWTPGSPPGCGRSPPSVGPSTTEDLATFYPNTVLVTGYDILFFWVVRMMMFGVYAMDGVAPFHTIALHGIVRDEFGRKMSKSRGNGIDPIEWMDAYGTDAMRFAFVRGANPGADLPMGDEQVHGGEQVLHQAVERHPVRPAQRRQRGRRPTVGPDRCGRLDRLPAASRDRRDRRLLRGIRVRQGGGSALALRLGRGMRLVRRAGQGQPQRRRRPRRDHDPAGAGRGAGRATAPAASGHAVHHRGVVDGAHRRGIGHDRAVARGGSEPSRRRRRDRHRPGSRRGHRGAPVPFRAGPASGPAGAGAGHRPGRGPGVGGPRAAASGAAGGRVHADGQVDHGRRGRGLARHLRTIDVAAERARLGRDRAAAVKEQEQAHKKLANEAFLAKAPEQIVVGIRARLAAAEAEISRMDAALAALPGE